MANVTLTGVLNPNDDEIKTLEDVKIEKHQYKLVWRNIFIMLYMHLAALYGLWLLLAFSKRATVVFTIAMYFFGGFGVTGGVHRLWAHRSYKAKWPMRLFCFLGNTASYQGPIVWWARDHRTHHKYSETEADPHNIKRGFFFAHVGWLLVTKHPMVKKMGETIDVSDLLDDPFVVFQFRHYLTLLLLICFAFPTLLPVYFWGETFTNAYHLNILRVVLVYHAVWQLNSFAHSWGSKPYDKSLKACDNRGVDLLAMGEGTHNYHHTFPWDYRGSNLFKSYNLTTWFIEFFAVIGWAYDLKVVSDDVVKRRGMRTGDGTLLL